MEDNIVFHRGHPVPHCAAFAGPAGPAFFFLPCPSFSQRFLSEWGQRWFSLAWTSLVSFPYLSSIPHTALHRASFFFASKTRLPLPLKGEGPGIVCLGFVGFAPLGHSCLTRLQQGRFGGWLVFAPYSASKTAHRATQGRVWFSPFFLSALWV